LFDKHKENEANSRRRLKTYKETYLEFKYDSPSTTLEDSFNISNFNYNEVGPSGEVQEVQSSSPTDLKGGDITKDDVNEQIVAQVEE